MEVASMGFILLVLQFFLLNLLYIYNLGLCLGCPPLFTKEAPQLFYFATLSNYYVNPLAFGVATAFIFTTVRVAVDQDYLHRDVLRWKSLGWILFLGLEFLTLLAFPVFVVFHITVLGNAVTTVTVSRLADGNILVSSPLTFTNSPIVVLYGTIPFVLIPYFGAILIVGSVRSSDPTLKRFTLWLGLVAVAAIIAEGLNFLSIFYYLPTFFIFIPYGVALYLWYRAAGALTPSSKREPLPEGEPLTAPPTQNNL